MSDRSRLHARRSVLAVPGSSDRFLAKAPQLDADMFMLDLEDAVAPSEKSEARLKVAQAIRNTNWGEAIVAVRVNSFATAYTLRDLVEVVTAAGPRLDCIVLAKTASAQEIAAVDLMLTQLEIEADLSSGQVGIEALIESAQGLADVRAIAGASSRLEAIAFGPGDLAASLGIPMGIVGDKLPDYPGDHYHAVCMELLLAARSHGLQVIDGPYLGLADDARLREMSLRTRALGFDGKWAIHPDQIAIINEVFSPSEEEVARAREMLAAMDRAHEQEGRGAIRHGGEMFDEVNRKMAIATLARLPHTERVQP